MDRVISLTGSGAATRGAALGTRVSERALPTRLILLEDEALARLAARGSSRAFAVLYERYQQQLYTYCYLFLHDADDAYDALQSALTRALDGLRKGERDELFRPWLFRIANREAHELARARTDAQAAERRATVDVPWVEEPAEERARLAVLVADLRELPEMQRSALLMRELTGLSHQEIATALGVTRQSARQAIFHARRSLEDFREGRDLVCEEVRRMLSHEDGRLLRRHVVRAHLRECSPCTAFAESIKRRQRDMLAVAPVLPAALAGGLLAELTHASGMHGIGGVTAGAAGKGVGSGVVTKAVAVGAVALTASAGVGVGAVKLIDRPHHTRHSAKPAVVHTRAHGGRSGASNEGAGVRGAWSPAAGPGMGSQGLMLPGMTRPDLPASLLPAVATGGFAVEGAATIELGDQGAGADQATGSIASAGSQEASGGNGRQEPVSQEGEEASSPPAIEGAGPEEGSGRGGEGGHEGGGPGAKEGHEGGHRPEGEHGGEGNHGGEGAAGGEGAERGGAHEKGAGAPSHPSHPGKEEAGAEPGDRGRHEGGEPGGRQGEEPGRHEGEARGRHEGGEPGRREGEERGKREGEERGGREGEGSGGSGAEHGNAGEREPGSGEPKGTGDEGHGDEGHGNGAQGVEAHSEGVSGEEHLPGGHGLGRDKGA